MWAWENETEQISLLRLNVSLLYTKMFPPALLSFCLSMCELASVGWIAKVCASTPCPHQQPRGKMWSFHSLAYAANMPHE